MSQPEQPAQNNDESSDEAAAGGSTPEEIGRWLMEQVESGTRDLEDLEAAFLERQRAARRLALDLRELPSHLDPHNLRHCRWAVITPPGESDRVRSALRPLIERRGIQADREIKVIEKEPRETGTAFLERHQQREGTIDPEKLPYYLLIVGDPEQISFDFQYRLSLGRAVGRIGWSRPLTRVAPKEPERGFDRDGLHAYARAVCRAEEHGVARERAVGLFSVDNDRTLKSIARHLIDPVAMMLNRSFPDWPILQHRGEEARHEVLRDLLGGGETPGLLLLSSHGRRCDPGAAEQELVHGSPVAYPREGGGDGLFTAEHLSEPRDLHGLIAFFFHCNGAGVPQLDDYPHTAEGQEKDAALRTAPRNYAGRSFLQPIPQILLRNGALAIVAHVERAWTLSNHWPTTTQTIGTSATVEDSLYLLLSGHRLGHAMRPLARRYSQLSAHLNQMLNYERQGRRADLRELGLMWTAVNDARNLIMLGDPAVYLLGQRQAPAQPRIAPELVQEIQLRAPNKSLDAFVQEAVRHELDRLREEAEHQAVLGL